MSSLLRQNILADRVSLRGKSLLVFRHDVSLIHGRIVVEIIGDLQNLKASGFHFIHCEIKQVPVVRLKFDRPFITENLRKPSEKFLAGEPPLGVPVLGPRIREVEIDSVHFSLAEVFTDQLRVSSDKQQICDLRLIQFVQCPDQYAGIFLDSHVTDLRILLRQPVDKFTLSGSDFQMDRVIVSVSTTIRP